MPDAPIPDAWPPAENSGDAVVVPMFPLPGLFLFPRQLLPLHIHEPRYRRMIEDGLDGPVHCLPKHQLSHRSPPRSRPRPRLR